MRLLTVPLLDQMMDHIGPTITDMPTRLFDLSTVNLWFDCCFHKFLHLFWFMYNPFRLKDIASMTIEGWLRLTWVKGVLYPYKQVEGPTVLSSKIDQKQL